MDDAKSSPFACVMSAIEPDKRETHLATIKLLFQSTQDIRELPDGYAFQLANDSETLKRAADFISLEMLCCPFLGFRLEVEPEAGSLWLSLTGREGVKPFIQAEIGEYLNQNLVRPLALSRVSTS